MKKLVSTALLLSAFGNVQAQKEKPIQTVLVKTSINCDHCKQCATCAERLEKAVYEVKGVKRVDIDEKENTLKIVFNNQKTNLDAIRTAINKAGYDADDTRADADGYAGLDDCCKK